MALRLLFQPVHRLHWYNAPPFSVNLSIKLLRRSLFFSANPHVSACSIAPLIVSTTNVPSDPSSAWILAAL
eukprot:jgi/Psemu1/307260/fgenesh1_kg.317_\